VSASADGSLRGWTLAGPEARPRRTMEAVCKNVGGAQCVAFTQDAVLTGRATSPHHTTCPPHLTMRPSDTGA